MLIVAISLSGSGRADYFGSTANLAARVLGQAKGGQSLVTFDDESCSQLPVNIVWDSYR